MEKKIETEKEYAKIEQQRLKEDRIARWKILGVLFSMFSAYNVIRYYLYGAPFLYSVPYLFPTAVSWIMCLISWKFDTVEKRNSRIIYRTSTVILTFAVFVSFIIMMVYEFEFEIRYL